MTDEYPEEFTDGQRRAIVIVCVTLAALLVFGVQFLLFPQMEEFAVTAHCYEFLGISGPALMMYGLFAGMPLLMALTIGVWFSWRGARVIRQQRTPLAGEKVFQRRPVIRGERAVRYGWFHQIPLAVLLVITLLGSIQAQSVLAQAAETGYDYRICAFI